MDRNQDAILEIPISDTPIPIPPAHPHARWSGWLIGALCGVLASLWLFPSVRYTLAAQLQFALAEDSLPWLSSLDARRGAKEATRLNDAAMHFPDDYLLQVGRATALATVGGVREAAPPVSSHLEDWEYSDHTLFRLGTVARHFATTPGAYAHLARYLMTERIRIERAELSGGKANRDKDSGITRTVTPSRRNLKIMLWALRSGERLDGDNAFWPAMLAATYFAAEQDADAIDALNRASRKTRWDAYIYEEVLGQWRLFSAAYGDHGATQQVGPLSLVVFPHLYEIRRMAEMARWCAEHAASLHQDEEAARIRRSLARLGVNLRDNAGWAFEALYGTALFFIACTDSEAPLGPNGIRTPEEWEAHATGYHALLLRMHREFEYRLLRPDVQTCCDLRQRVDLARYDSPYPGVPPLIPLAPLFGSWMAGICLIQQALGILIAVVIGWAWKRGLFVKRHLHASIAPAVLILFLLATAATGGLFMLATPTPRLAALFFMGLTMLSILAIEHLWRRFRPNPPGEDLLAPRNGGDRLSWDVRNALGNGGAAFDFDGGTAGQRQGAKWSPLPQIGPEFRDLEARSGANDLAQGIEAVRARWTYGTTIRMLLVVLLPYLMILYSQRDELRSLHPVAILLTSLTGTPRPTGLRGAVELALLASALPMLLPLASGLWGAYRGVSPLLSALVGLRRLALPSLVCMVVAYAVLLDQTLILDAEASQAIQRAAENDRQWVLTHGSDGPF